MQISEIRIPKDRREVNPKTVVDLVESMELVGLINPITVNEDGTLIAGAHRLEAAKTLGWKEIACNVVSLDSLKAKLVELDENIVRNNGDFVSRGEWLLERKKVYEMLYPAAKKGQSGGWNNNKGANLETEIISFSKDAAAKTGVSPRTIETEIQIAERLTPDAKKIVREMSLPKTTALHIARLPAETQQSIVQVAETMSETESEEEVIRYIADTSKQMQEERRAQLIAEDKLLSRLANYGNRMYGHMLNILEFELYDLERSVPYMVKSLEKHRTSRQELNDDIVKAIEILNKVKALMWLEREENICGS